mmetsp:Transcript_6362/g.14397  ORF Transcript_6362/g.14397 Transcript_6362/m.14397 type:complete len:108 (+) Transcript_6362:123-446(+)
MIMSPLQTVVLFGLFSVTIHAVPYLLLTSTKPKCVDVVASRGTTLFIDYHAPGMFLCHSAQENALFCSSSLLSLFTFPLTYTHTHFVGLHAGENILFSRYDQDPRRR